MSGVSSIEWTDATWNPVRGCTRVSPGCTNCYAEEIAARFSGPGLAYEGLAKRVGGDARWTNVVRFLPEKLDWPLRWKGAPQANAEGRPSRIFVNSMSDLFHEGLSFKQIAAVFGVMAAAPLHVFQVLTKRPQRALEFCSWVAARGRLGPYIRSILGTDEGRSMAALFDQVIRTEKYRGKTYRSAADPWAQVINAAAVDGGSVLPFNVWLGVSVENQETADERIPLLLQCPAAVLFVSYEPALAPVSFDRGGWLRPSYSSCQQPDSPLVATIARTAARQLGWAGLDWLIVGGESGLSARPFDVAWARSTVEQCRETGVACFVKQLGARPYQPHRAEGEWGPRVRVEMAPGCPAGPRDWIRLRDGHGGDWSEWAKDLRIRQFPAHGAMV